MAILFQLLSEFNRIIELKASRVINKWFISDDFRTELNKQTALFLLSIVKRMQL